MGDLVDHLGAVFADGAIAVTALLGVAAIAMVACGQPARRLLLARVAILGALAVIPLAMLSPVPRVPVASALASLAPPHLGFSAIGIAPPSFPWRRGMVALGAVGVGIGFGFLFAATIAGRRILSRTIEPSPETLATYATLPCGSWRPRPRVRVSARVRGPILVGTIRPTILIPPDLDEPEGADSLRLALLHEIAHHERRDPIFVLAGGIAAALWFFIPPLWWVRRQMRLDQEFLADCRASAKFGAGRTYASSLVGMAKGAAEPELQPKPGADGVSTLFQRVLMLVRCPYPVEAHAPRLWAMACASALACGTVLASGLTLRAPGAIGCPSHSRGPIHGSLHLGRLTIEAQHPGPKGPPPPYTVLRALPPRFEMVVDVWAEPADLVAIAIAGRWLGPVEIPKDEPPLPPGYHKVRMVRDDAGLKLWVAGREIPPSVSDRAIPDLLDVEPAPGRLGKFRNLFLTY